MTYSEADGLIFYESPLTVKYLDFAFQHMGCDSIAVRDSVFEPDKTKIVAYASAKEYNPQLWKVFKSDYGKENYAIMKHMSEAEAYSID
ncbi:MAG: hypothetical protein IJR00_11825 [Lachnospiraceae bacterium]|nr:hypothetical protein [Lachnospiraceae bacterium]